MRYVAVREGLGRMSYLTQESVKRTGRGLALWIFKGIIAGFVGLTLALVGEEIIGYGVFSFAFVLSFFALIVLRILRRASFLWAFVFSVILVLVGALLRLYVMLAPGA